MIGWGWLIAAFVVGEIFGFICAAICSGNWDKKEEREKEKQVWEALMKGPGPLPGNGGQKEEPPALQR